MNLRKIGLRAGTAGALAVLALSGLAGQAAADSVNIDYWSTNTTPNRCGYGTGHSFCLYYSPGAEGAIWSGDGIEVSNLSGATFRNDGYGSAGAGQAVRNNAASAEQFVGNCILKIYVYPGYVGDSNYLTAAKGGNLTAKLRNNEASLRLEACS